MKIKVISAKKFMEMEDVFTKENTKVKIMTLFQNQLVPTLEKPHIPEETIIRFKNLTIQLKIMLAIQINKLSKILQLKKANLLQNLKESAAVVSVLKLDLL